MYFSFAGWLKKTFRPLCDVLATASNFLEICASLRQCSGVMDIENHRFGCLLVSELVSPDKLRHTKSDAYSADLLLIQCNLLC